MELGIFAKTFTRPSVEAVFDAVAAEGLTTVQFNMSCAGLDPMPAAIPDDLLLRIRNTCKIQRVRIAALSGTFNMAHPDPAKREEGLQRLRVLAQACAGLGTTVITLCTGTRDRDNMWKIHPENDSDEAWSDMRTCMTTALEIAASANVTLAIEPEVSNIVSSAAKARRLLDELRAPHLRVVLDGANLFPAGTLGQMRAILNSAINLLGQDLVLAHAKDLTHDGAAGDVPAGSGVLDYELYLGLLHRAGYKGPLIMHGLAESAVPRSIFFLRQKLSRVGIRS